MRKTTTAAACLVIALAGLPATASADPDPAPCPGYDELLNRHEVAHSRIEFWASDSGYVAVYYRLAANTLTLGANGYGMAIASYSPSWGGITHRILFEDNIGCFWTGWTYEPGMSIIFSGGAWGISTTQSESCEVSVWAEYTTEAEVSVGIDTSASGGSKATMGASVTCGSSTGKDYDSELLLKGNLQVSPPASPPPSPPPTTSSDPCVEWRNDLTNLSKMDECLNQENHGE